MPEGKNEGDKRREARKKGLNPGQTLALGFLALILIGATLLTLPQAAADGRSLGWLKGLFTATSAVCVTGLSLAEAGRELSLFGQATLLGLIQVGGLGFMAFATLGMVLAGRKISLHGRILLSESMNQNGLAGMVRLSLWFFGMALVVELTGAALLATRFVPRFGLGKGLWTALFTAVSAFCNAGFDLFGQGNSLAGFQKEPFVLWVVALLIQLGGMGFAVLLELPRRRGRERLSLHARLVLSVNGILLALGTTAFFLLEKDNPATLGAEGLSLWERLTGALFQSVACRTAGFASVSQKDLTELSKLTGTLLMFVGASPASTGGGVKTTTFAALLLLTFHTIRGRDRITVFRRELPAGLVRRAVALTVVALGALLAATCAVAALERNSGIPLLDLFYETTSAMSTTGFSAAGTASLRKGSQLLLIGLMYMGRVGPLTLASALAQPRDAGAGNRMRYPEEKIMIG